MDSSHIIDVAIAIDTHMYTHIHTHIVISTHTHKIFQVFICIIFIYRIAGFDCEQNFLRMSYLGHRRNTCGFYIYEYVLCIELFCARVHVFGVIDVYFFIPCFYQCLFRLQ